MPVDTGEDVALVLLRSMPADLAAALLAKLPERTAATLKAKLQVPTTPPSTQDLDSALTEFFDLHRINERQAQFEKEEKAARIAKAESDMAKPLQSADEIFEAFSNEKIAKALAGEPAAAVSLILSGMSSNRAGAILKSLPQDLQAEAALRLAQPKPRNHELIVQLSRALAEKASKLADTPPEPTADERVKAVAGMLRALPREERLPILQRIETADPDLAAKIREALYYFDDLMRIEDRPLQPLLAELDMKTLALALRGADPGVVTKVTNNISTRAREVLNEERELIATAPNNRVMDARAKVITLIRTYEEAGKITIET